MTLVMALLFSGAIISIQKYGLIGIKDYVLEKGTTIFLSIFVIIYLYKAARSFSVGFHMSLKILNLKFKLKDEKLYDDLEND